MTRRNRRHLNLIPADSQGKQSPDPDSPTGGGETTVQDQRSSVDQGGIPAGNAVHTKPPDPLDSSTKDSPVFTRSGRDSPGVTLCG